MNPNSRRLLFLFLILLVSCAISGQAPAKHQVNDTTYMLTYDHGGLILWGSNHFKERLDNAVEWLNKYPSFKIGLDNEAQIYDYFAENEPQLLKELNDLLLKYKGRFGIGSCTYGQPLSEFISDESNIRQISYALEAERKYFHYRPPVYLMSEHAMHSQIPQILNGFGFDGAIMRTHFMMYGYNPTFDVPVGWWVGIDGSKIETIPTYVGEGAEFAILPFKGNWKAAGLHKKALEYSFQAPTFESNSGKGNLGNSINTFLLDGEDDVILTALLPHKGDIIACFFKSNDQKQVTTLHFEKKGKGMVETNLDGKFLRNTSGNIDFKPWQIKTFQIQSK